MSAKKLSKGEIKVINGYIGGAAETAKNIGLAATYVEKLLRKDYILSGIKNRADQEKQTKAIADRQERQAFWSSVMRGDPQVVKIVETKDDATGQVIKTEEIKEVADMKNRLKAAELLGRSEADFIERLHLLGVKDGVKKEITDDMDAKQASNIYFDMLKGQPAGSA